MTLIIDDLMLFTYICPLCIVYSKGHNSISMVRKVTRNGQILAKWGSGICTQSVLTDVLHSCLRQKRGILHKWGPKVGPARSCVPFTQLTWDPGYSTDRNSNGPNRYYFLAEKVLGTHGFVWAFREGTSPPKD